jgi:putative transposase
VTAPRQIVPGRYWMVTRRCTQRQFLLRPSSITNAYFEYCLALAAKRSGVQVIAYLAMSNHYHAVVFDPLGQLPVFLECVNKAILLGHSIRTNLPQRIPLVRDSKKNGC